MNFLGMGMMEMAVILLVAFLALGPNRSVTMARNAGKLMRDLQRTLSEIVAAVNLEPGPERPSRQTSAPPEEPRSDDQPRDQQ